MNDDIVMLLSEWVLDKCLGIPEDQLSEAEEIKVTLAEATVVAYGNHHVRKVPLLQWCKEMCEQHKVSRLRPGTRLMVYWWDQRHDEQEKRHSQGRTWWPVSYVSEYPDTGVWFSARVLKYDSRRGVLQQQQQLEERPRAAAVQRPKAQGLQLSQKQEQEPKEQRRAPPPKQLQQQKSQAEQQQRSAAAVAGLLTKDTLKQTLVMAGRREVAAGVKRKAVLLGEPGGGVKQQDEKR
ncbi:hypothetical protein GPECTOR_34g703 [Gonium pectorale]|uniref:Uncharacterized protein n=1 Tax=Gonium pectorale TaxID=33097 RepID=A0A150GCH5_GONPE|nr:hypothetical protein GPECTOR_34g703 [Gonium pectorale]|eukprot:KXZ47544.1 hypothetical protein GPECTOR_34g703 [Gonium pectorale]